MPYLAVLAVFPGNLGNFLYPKLEGSSMNNSLIKLSMNKIELSQRVIQIWIMTMNVLFSHGTPLEAYIYN